MLKTINKSIRGLRFLRKLVISIRLRHSSKPYPTVTEKGKNKNISLTQISVYNQLKKNEERKYIRFSIWLSASLCLSAAIVRVETSFLGN